VIQPLLPERLPCYDLALITEFTLDIFLSNNVELKKRLRVLPTFLT